MLALNQPEQPTDSARESRRLPQFSESHNRFPLGISGSEMCHLPEIAIPAIASSLQCPFGFPMASRKFVHVGVLSLPS